MFDLDSLEREARSALGTGQYEWVAAGAEDELTVHGNLKAWQEIWLRPHALRDLSALSTRADVLGAHLKAPIMVAPSGRQRLLHPEGEIAMARGVEEAGLGMVVSCHSTCSLEQISDAAPTAPLWLQVTFGLGHGQLSELMMRAKRSRYLGIVVTVDSPVPGRSPRAARSPMADVEDLRFVNLEGCPPANSVWDEVSVGVPMHQNIDELAWLTSQTSLPVIVKGILRGDDAVMCIEAGAAALIVSNHGGRHLDSGIPTAVALGEVRTAVPDHVEVYVDGGIRRGTDVLKAICLGARAVMLGRPPLWGLAVDGSSGVARVLDYFVQELRRAMALCGVPTMSDVSSDLLVLASNATR